jgi:hypothetical protein
MSKYEEYDWKLIETALKSGVLLRVAKYYTSLDSIEYIESSRTNNYWIDDVDEDNPPSVYLHMCTLCKWKEPKTSRWESCYLHIKNNHPEVKTLMVLIGDGNNDS